jgi:hypothetical protein
MSDNLRDRIAAVVSERYRHDPTNDAAGWAANLADAVIRELGLIRDPFSTVAFCRYVTQWQRNERFAPYCNRCGIPHTEPCRRPADA